MSRLTPALLLAGLVAGLASLLLAGGGSALGWSGGRSARAPLTWSPRALIDQSAPFADGYSLTGLACPARNLCVAVDDRGMVLSSSNPAGGAQAWKGVRVSALGAISCPSARLCVAAGSGGLLVSRAPTGGAGAWQRIKLPGESGGPVQGDIVGIACPSTTFCLAVDSNDRAWTSARPAGGAAAWQRQRGTIANQFDQISGVSCPTTQFCAVMTQGGQLATSGDPSGGTGTWHKRMIDQASVNGGANVNGIDCPSAQLCLVADSNGSVLSSTAPATGSWQAQIIERGASLRGPWCPSASFCFVADNHGRIFGSSDPTGGAGAWTSGQAIPNSQAAVNGLVCPSDQLCVAVGDDGYAATTPGPSGAPQWTAQRIDGFNTLVAVTCARSWCAAVDDAGDVLTSANPAGGASAWRSARIDPGVALTDISCPTSKLCLVVDAHGGVLSSTNPAGGAGAWRRIQLDNSDALTTITCATRAGQRPVCLALAGYPIQALGEYAPDFSGAPAPGGSDTIFTTNNPTGGASAWREAVLDAHGSHHDALDTAVCPSVRLCVVGDNTGGVLSSTHPGAGPGGWKEVNLRAKGAGPITGTSCPSVRLCVVVDNNGIVVASTRPAGVKAGWRVQVPGGFEHFAPGDVLCPSTALCVADTIAGSYFSTDPAGGHRAWHSFRGLPVSPPAIACRPQSTRCVAAVGAGYIRTSR